MNPDPALASEKETSGRTLWRIAGGTFSNYAGKILVLGAWFWLTPYLLRSLGPTDYALYVLVGSLAAYAGLLDMGMSNMVTKFVAEHLARGDAAGAGPVVTAALMVYFVLAAVIIALGVSLAPVVVQVLDLPETERAGAPAVIAVACMSAALGLPSALPYAILNGAHRFDLTNLLSAVGMGGLIVTTVATIACGGGILGVVAANIPITLILQAPAIWLVGRVVPRLRLDARGLRLSTLRQVLRFGSALFVLDLAGQIKGKTDEWVIGASLPLSRITPYSLARRISDIPQLLTDQFLRVVMPVASGLSVRENTERLTALYWISSRLALALFLPFALMVLVFQAPLITLWVGADYVSDPAIVLVLVMASLIDISQWPTNAVLQGLGRHQRLAVLSLAGACLNLGLSVVLVRTHGVIGVALGTLIATVVESLLFVWPYSLRVMGATLKDLVVQVWGPTFGAALPSGLALALWHGLWPVEDWWQLAVAGCLGGVIYAVVYLALPITRRERDLLRGMLQRVLTVWSVALRRRSSSAPHAIVPEPVDQPPSQESR